jgi:hypothetical protein
MTAKIKVVTDRGDFLVDCHGTFHVQFNGIDFMFAIVSKPSGSGLQVVEYGSGLRWTIPFDHGTHDHGPRHPDAYKLIEAEAIAKIKADAVLKGGDETVSRIILAQQNRFKTNELDF